MQSASLPTTSRQAFRTASGRLLATASGRCQTRKALSRRAWRSSDVRLLIDGLLATINVSSLIDPTRDTSGPVRIDVRVPIGVDTMVVATDGGFGHGFEIRFVPDAGLAATRTTVPTVAEVTIPATDVDDGWPVRVGWSPDSVRSTAAARRGLTGQRIGAGATLTRGY